MSQRPLRNRSCTLQAGLEGKVCQRGIQRLHARMGSSKGAGNMSTASSRQLAGVRGLNGQHGACPGYVYARGMCGGIVGAPPGIRAAQQGMQACLLSCPECGSGALDQGLGYSVVHAVLWRCGTVCHHVVA